jgi:hypothetical protein
MLLFTFCIFLFLKLFVFLQKEQQYEDTEDDVMNLLDGEEKYFERSASINFTQMNLKTEGIFLITNFRLCFLYSPLVRTVN